MFISPKIIFVIVSQQRSAAPNTLPIYVERIFMFISPKIIFVIVSQQRSAASNTLPVYVERTFLFMLPKIIFVIVSQQRFAASNTLPISWSVMLVGMVDTMMVSHAGEAAISGVALVDMLDYLIIGCLHS